MLQPGGQHLVGRDSQIRLQTAPYVSSQVVPRGRQNTSATTNVHTLGWVTRLEEKKAGVHYLLDPYRYFAGGNNVGLEISC